VVNEWHTGNAASDGAKYRGWILGHFIDADESPERSTKDLEVKWGIHPAGEAGPEWTNGEQRTTLLLLVRDAFGSTFPLVTV
jgi:hypothetical protein